MIETVLDEEKRGTRRKQGRGGGRNKEEGGTRRKESQGGKRGMESEIMKKLKNEKVAKGCIIGLAGPCLCTFLFYFLSIPCFSALYCEFTNSEDLPP